MKTRKLYLIRSYTGIRNAGKSLGSKLRSYNSARALVKRLKSRGMDVQAWPVKVSA